MHAYSSNADDRGIVPVFLAVLSVVFALSLNWVFSCTGVVPPWWFDSPSVVGFYGILHYMYDRYLWRRCCGSLRMSAIPVVAGTWVATIKPKEHGEVDGVMWISQTWTKISAHFETESSKSFSSMACLNTHDGPEPGLKYEYLNEPKSLADDALFPHRGTAHLMLHEEEHELIGNYYTGRGRQGIGEAHFRRVSSERVSYTKALELARQDQGREHKQ